MKRSFTFFLCLAAWATLCLLGLAPSTARAQTVINITGSTCNIAQTACVLQGDGGQVIMINPNPDTAASAPVTMSVDGVDYVGAYTSYVPDVVCPPRPYTCHEVSYDFTITFSPTATLTGVHDFRWGGSGRGGYARHSFFDFQTLTVY